MKGVSGKEALGRAGGRGVCSWEARADRFEATSTVADLGLMLSVSQIVPLLTPGTQTSLSTPASRSTAVSGSSPNGPPPGSLSRPL